MSIRARLVKLEQARGGTKPTRVIIFIDDEEYPSGKVWTKEDKAKLPIKKVISITGDEDY